MRQLRRLRLTVTIEVRARPRCSYHASRGPNVTFATKKPLASETRAVHDTAPYSTGSICWLGRTPCPVTPSSNWGWTWIMVQAPPKRKKRKPCVSRPRWLMSARIFSVSEMVCATRARIS
ncbi:hypothetical protein GL4_0662 [Methyloceanibacter caenitepidi]|uniref:Uncharacterized protein n=1 Tax=Methyloceanibacter caenitepidi TaxID=1384459 RepID=A0A0A8JZX1_9HYPH|nr:hypothetical protein GL4_0662 [Methyloceanibacter caenitepidi]